MDVGRPLTSTPGVRPAEGCGSRLACPGIMARRVRHLAAPNAEKKYLIIYLIMLQDVLLLSQASCHKFAFVVVTH